MQSFGLSTVVAMDTITPTSHLRGTRGLVTVTNTSGTDNEIPFRMLHSSFAVFWQIVPPFILLFGIFGNVMIIVICRRADVMSSMSVYFVTLAVSDLLSLFLNVFNEWVHYTFDIDFMSLHTLACKLIIFFIYVSGVLSAWILVAMTVQRAVCVLWPHRADILCSARNSKAIALTMILFIMILHCHVLYGHDMVYSSNTHMTTTTPDILHDPTHTSSSYDINFKGDKNEVAVCVLISEYVGFYFSVWSWVDLLIFSVLPWLCLVVSNSVLLWTLNVSIRQAQHSLGSAHTLGFSDRKKQVSSMTVTLFAVSMAFIVLTLPMSFIQVLGFYYYVVGSLDYYHKSEVIAQFNEIALALYETNTAVNFYLYCLTGSKFRKQLKRAFSCGTPQMSMRAPTASSAGETKFH